MSMNHPTQEEINAYYTEIMRESIAARSLDSQTLIKLNSEHEEADA